MLEWLIFDLFCVDLNFPICYLCLLMLTALQRSTIETWKVYYKPTIQEHLWQPKNLTMFTIYIKLFYFRWRTFLSLPQCSALLRSRWFYSQLSYWFWIQPNPSRTTVRKDFLVMITGRAGIRPWITQIGMASGIITTVVGLSISELPLRRRYKNARAVNVMISSKSLGVLVALVNCKYTLLSIILLCF